MALLNDEYDIDDLLKTAVPVDDFSEDDYKFLESSLPATILTSIDTSISESYHNIHSAAEFNFKFIEQPQEKFNFRFKSQTKPKDGYLRGISTSNRNLKTYPKVALHFQSSKTTIKEFFVRCTLHQVPAIAGESSCISPHLLWRRGNGGGDDCHILTSETTYFPFTKEAPNLHTFTLEEFVIISMSRKDWVPALKYKLRKLDLDINSKMDLSGKQEKEYERIAYNQECKPQDKVRLCFEVFEKHDNYNNNESYIRIAGPFYSNSISNGQAPYIKNICNNSGFINEMTEVTLLVAPVKANDRIIISETKNDINADEHANEDREDLWTASIPLEVKMLNNVKDANVITFQMPIYGGRKYNFERIICKIQLERWSDGALSNVKNFEYINKLKRRHNNSNTHVAVKRSL